MTAKEGICPTLILYISMENDGKGRVSQRAEPENTKKNNFAMLQKQN